MTSWAMAGQTDELICINQRMHIHGNAEDVIHSHAIREAYRASSTFWAASSPITRRPAINMRADTPAAPRHRRG